MAFNPTVTELVTNVRQRTNMEKSLFVTDTEIVGLLNRAHAELYDLVVSVNENYFVNDSTFALNGDEFYALPADLYKLIGVDLHVDSDRTISLRRFNFAERNKYKTTIYVPHIPASIYSYNVQGLRIKFIPKPIETRDITLWYVPLPSKLVLSNPQTGEVSSLDIRLAMYDDYVTIDAAINVLIKEESSVTALESERQIAKERIIAAVSNRDQSEPDRINDQYAVNYPYFGGITPF